VLITFLEFIITENLNYNNLIFVFVGSGCVLEKFIVADAWCSPIRADISITGNEGRLTNLRSSSGIL